MGFLEALKALQELTKNGYSSMTIATASLIAVAWMHWIEGPAMTAKVTGVEASVQSIQVSQLEEKLEKTETALCMNRGDPGLLERRRELREQYEKLAGRPYNPSPCELLVKLAH